MTKELPAGFHSLDIHRQAIYLFGESYQLHRCVEELSELSLAIQKLTRIEAHTSKEKRAVLIREVANEIADVFETLEYPKIIFGITESNIADASVRKRKKFQKYIDAATNPSKEIE